MPLMIDDPNKKTAGTGAKLENAISNMPTKGASKKPAAASTGMSGDAGITAAPTPNNATNGTAPTAGTAGQQAAPSYKVDETSPWAGFGNALNDQDESKFESLLPQIWQPGSDVYCPYVTATNVNALTAFGQLVGKDFSGGISKEDYDYYYGLYYNDTSIVRTPKNQEIASPNSLSPAQKKDKNLVDRQTAAYAFKSIADAETATSGAEKELQAVQDEIKYWVGRTDLNLSDADIRSKVESLVSKSKYLKPMGEAAAKGGATQLNRGVNFADNLIDGMIWAARNEDKAMGTAQFNSIYAAMGVGNKWEERQVNQYQKIDTASYNPYRVGSTMDDLCRKYGVTEFTREWLNNPENAQRLRKDGNYDRVNGAINNTEKARAEAEGLTEWVTEMANAGIEIKWDELYNSHSYGKGKSVQATTLKGMIGTLGQDEDGIRHGNGKLKDTAGVIDFDVDELKNLYNRIVNEKKYPGYNEAFAGCFGEADAFYTDAAADEAASAALAKFRDVLLTYGTDDDRGLVRVLNGLVDPEQKRQFVENYVESGALTKQEAMWINYRIAEDYASDNYMANAWVIKNYEEAQKKVDEGMKLLKDMGLEYNPDYEPTGLSWQADYSKDIEELLNNTGYERPAWFPAGSDDIYYKVSHLKEIAERIQSGDPELENEPWYQSGNPLLENLLQAIVELPEHVLNRNGEWTMAAGENGAPPTYQDMLDQAKDNTNLNKIYGQIRTNQKVLDEYGEKAYNDAKDIVKRIYDNYDIAGAYGELAYGPAEYYADGTGNHAAHMVSWGKEVGDQNLRAMDCILSFGAEDYKPTASQTAAQYLMMMSNDIGYIKAQGAAERQINPDDYTDEMAREDAANFRGKALKECSEQLKRIEELEKILDIYHVNLSDDSPSGGKMKPYENFLAYKEDLQEIVGFMQTQLDADKDPYFDRYVQEGIKAANKDAEGQRNFWNPDGNVGVTFALALKGQMPGGNADVVRAEYSSQTGTNEQDWKMYLYLYGKYGAEKADEYYNFALKGGVGVNDPSEAAAIRYNAKLNTEYNEAANKPGFEGFWNRVSMSAASVIASPMQITGTIYSTIKKVTGQEINPYSPAFDATRLVTGTRSAVSEYLNNTYGEAGGFLYDVLMSGIDSSINAAIMGPVLGTFTAGGATTISHLMHVLGGNFLSAAPMGLQAMGAAVWSAKMSGASDDEAYAVGLMNFLCETVTETITAKNIHDAFASGATGALEPHSFGEFLKELFKDMGEESVGEMLAEKGEEWANRHFMGDNSDFERNVAEYMELGMSETAARQQAEKDAIHDILMAGLSGALMAAGTSSFHYALGTMKSSIGKFLDGEETYVRRQYAIEEARLKYNIEEIDEKLTAANKVLEEKGGYWAQKSVDYYTGQKERAEKEFTEWKGKSIGIFEYWMQNERGKAQSLENEVIRGSEAVNGMGMPSAEGMEGIGDGYGTMPKDRAEIDERTREIYNREMEAQQPAIQRARQEAEDTRTQARKDADTAYETAMNEAESRLQAEMERIDQADAQTEADFQKRFEEIDSSKKNGTIKAKQTARLQNQYEQWQAGRDANRETAVYNAQNAYYTAVAAAEQARDAAYQEADDIYVGAVETANLNAEEQATNAANAQANRWIDAMADDAAQAAANKRAEALSEEAVKKAEADAVHNDLVEMYNQEAEEDRKAAQKKLEEATAKAEAEHEETLGYVGNIADEKARETAKAKADADYQKAIDAAQLEYNSAMRSIDENLGTLTANLEEQRKGKYAVIEQARAQEEAEADNAYNAAMNAIGKRYDGVPAVNASDAANDWQVSTEQFQKALDGFESAVQIGDRGDIDAAGQILHETASGVMDALNGIKASIQAEIEASGKPMTEPQKERLNAVQTTADWVQAILDYADGKQTELSTEGVPVTAETEPAGEPAPAAESVPSVETEGQVSYSLPVEAEESAPAGNDYRSISAYLDGEDSRFSAKKMVDPYILTDKQCENWGVKNKTPIYATYNGEPGRYYGNKNSGLFIPLKVNPAKAKTLEFLEKHGAVKIDYMDLGLETFKDGSIGAVEAFKGNDPFQVAKAKAPSKAKTEPAGQPANVQPEAPANAETESDSANEKSTPVQENTETAQAQTETEPAKAQEEIAAPEAPVRAETEPAGEPAGAQPEEAAPEVPGVSQINGVPGAQPVPPPAPEPTGVEPVGAPAAVQEGSGYDFDSMRKPYLLDKKEQKKLGIDSSTFFYATHNGTLGRFYGTENSGGTFVPLEINPKAVGSRSVLKSMPGVVEVKPGAVKAAGIQTYSNDSAEAVAIFNGQDPATAAANDRKNVPAGVAPQVNPEAKGGIVNENGEQVTPEPKGPKQTGLTLDDLINGFKESAANAFNTVRDALNTMRRQQEAKEQNQNEINARAIVLDAYKTVQDLVNQAKEWYERWVSLTYSKDKKGAKEAQDKVSEVYDQLTQAWDNFRMLSGMLDTVTANNGKQQQTTNPEAADPTSMAIVALNKAEGSGDTAVQFTTVSAVLNRKPVNSSDANSGARAGATTKALFDVFGVTDTFQGLRHVFADAYRSGTSLDTVKSAITTLALGGDQGTNTLRQMFNGNLSAAAGVQAAIDLAPSTQGILNRKVTDYQKAIELRRLISQGGLAETKQAEKDLNDALADMYVAQSDLDGKINESEQRQAELQDAMAEYERAQGMTDRDPRGGSGKRTNKQAALDTAAAAVSAATQSAGNAMTMVNNYRRGLENAQQAAASAKHKYEDAVSGAMQRLKAQATMNVNQANAENDARLAAEKEARDKEAAAQLEASKENAKNVADTASTEAERERQSRNADTMDADAYIEKYHKDASEEEKEEIRKAFNEEKSKRTDKEDDDATRKRFVRALERKFGVNIQMVDSSEGGTKMPYNGKYVEETNTIYLDRNATQGDAIYAVALHEMTHSIENTGLYKRFANILLDMKYGTDQAGKNRLQRDIQIRMELYNNRFAKMAEADKGFRYKPLDPDGARKEIVADLTGELLYGNQKYIDGLVEKDPGLGRRILNAITSFLKKMRGVNDPALERMENARKMFVSALKEAQRQMDSGARPMGSEGDVLASGKDGQALVKQFNGGTVSAEYSLGTWTDEEKAKVVNALRKSGLFTDEQISKWMDNIDSVGAVIGGNRSKLDFVAAQHHKFMKPNAEYVVTIDASTLCAKRLLYQGIFNEIQHRMPNTVFTPKDLTNLRNLMDDLGKTVPCGICYVESRRKWLDKFAKKWLDSYDGAYKPRMDELSTSDGLERLRKKHPDVYDDFVTYMKTRGSANPKLVELRTEYRGDIRSLTPGDIEKIIRIGGLRIQSFSDFETPHLMDMMQAVMDMASMKLTAQAYTKVPDFAWVFGDTGIKINLSLIGKGNGLDENGNLLFDSKEGMDIDKAVRLRDRYSKNVGTIIVGMNDAHIKAAMADPRIDFIIPFHKSGWKKSELKVMRSMEYYDDYTKGQNERRFRYDKNGKRIKPVETDMRTTVKIKEGNFYPIDYWEYDKTGKENAEIYLKKCAEDGRIPKFARFLVDNGDGSYSLQPDGSTDGYWKLLIDFKMYDNDGVGSEQTAVVPNFNMDEAMRVLDEYAAGDETPNELPVDMEVVDAYVEQYKKKYPREQYSLPVTPEMDNEYMRAVESGDTKKAQQMVDKAAEAAGYDTNYLVWRGDSEAYNELKTLRDLGYDDADAGNLGDGLYFTPVRSYAERFAKGGVLRKFYLKADAADLADGTVQQAMQEIIDDMMEYGEEPTNEEIIDELLNQLDKNAVIGHGVGGFSFGADEIAVQNSWQAKLADPVTYDNGVPIPLSKRFNDQNNDVRYSLPTDTEETGTYALPSEEALHEHIRAYLNGELDETGGTEPGKVQARAGFNPNTSRGFKATSDLGKPVHSPYQISRTLAHDLGIGDYIGTRKMNNMPRGVAGYYQTHAKYVAVRTRDAGTYGTTMHELGHAIADILGMAGTDRMVDAMRADPQGLNLDRYTDDDLKHEAFAEFAWRWFEGEQRARDFAGDDFTDQFERALREHGIDKQVQKAADEIRMWANASTGDMIESTIQHKSDRPKQGTLIERMRDAARTGLARMVDATSAAERLNHTIRDESRNRDIYIGIDVRSQMLLNQTAGKRAYNILMNNLTDARWNRIGEGLAPRLERTGITTKEYKILEDYLLAKHSIARDLQNKPVFDNDQLTPQARAEYIRRIEAEHPAVKAAAEAIQSFRKEFLQAMLVDTGYMSQATFDMLNRIYPDYVPTRRVKSDKADSGRPNGSSVKYEIKRATGSTEDIWSPIDTMADMVNSVVKMVSANNAAYAWHVAYGMYEGLGEYGRRITPDMVKQTFNTDALQQKIQDLIQDNVDSDVLDEVMKAINDARIQYKMKDGSSLDNVIEVQLPDGSKALYQMKDMELYNLLAQVNESSHGKGLEMVGKITKGMSALTTGSNPIFAVRNFLRDFQNSVNYGSWASNYVTGAFKWLLAFWDVWRTNSPLLSKFGVNPSEAYQDYVALGGGGYNRIDTESKKGARELRAGLVSKGSNTEGIGSIGRYVGKKLWNTMTLQALNEYVEQASRFAEYRFGKHNLNTGEGRTQAYLAAQDVTVDFGRRGYGRTAGVLKQIVPFFNASMQGVYRTSRMLSEGERSRALPRFMKTVLNTGITSAICAALLKGLLDDDAKEEFDMLSDGLKAGHFYLPNFAPDVLGDYPLIRIPLEQDPLAIAVHGMTTTLMWGKTPDGYALSMAATADAVLQNLNPIGSMIYDPLIDVQTNKNYYGVNITPTRQEGDYVTTQYSEDIPDVFVEAARLMDRLPIEGLNAYQIQYLAQQYTGFLGQMLIPAITKDNGKLGGIDAAIRAAQKRITSDPLLSNDCVGAFYDAREFLGQVTSAYDGQKLGDVFQDMDPNDYAACAGMAESLTKNVINPTYKEIKAYNTQIDDINGNETLTDKQKYELTSSIRREMLKRVMQANEQIGAFYDTYVRAPSLTNQLIFGKHYFKRK